MGVVMVGLPFVLSGVMGVVAAFLYGMEDKTVAGLVGFLLGFVALAVVAVVFALDVKFGGMAVVNKDWTIIMVFCSGCALEIWPESGVGRPAAILGVNKHSEG